MMKKANSLKNLFDLTGRVALVTGGSKGLGFLVATVLAEAGADVALCSRNRREVESAAAEVAGATGRKALGVAADVSSRRAVSRLVGRVETELGDIDILVSNAGINIRAEAERLREADWDAVLGVNLKGSFLAAQAVIGGMRKRQWGRIVFLGSIMSFISLPGRAPYAASKAGILGLTRTLGLEAARDGVCVNAICPGPFRTPMNEPLWGNDEKNQAMLAKIPMGRWGEPAEIQGLALYLCSPACSFMTGSAIMIDGGWTAQ